MTPEDLALRNATYRLFVELGRAPTAAEVGERLGLGDDAVSAGWRRLHEAHAVVLDGRGELRMLNPFSMVATPFVVDAGGRSWFANCGWDAFGIATVLRTDATIHTRCADCDEPIDLEVSNGRPVDNEPVWHVLVPARHWWSDIGFT
ncbi:MAG TPA: organomercurial lyase [Candidatus Limnocylindrales bacterium]